MIEEDNERIRTVTKWLKNDNKQKPPEQNAASGPQNEEMKDGNN